MFIDKNQLPRPRLWPVGVYFAKISNNYDCRYSIKIFYKQKGEPVIKHYKNPCFP